jgi:hypothetical protein
MLAQAVVGQSLGSAVLGHTSENPDAVRALQATLIQLAKLRGIKTSLTQDGSIGIPETLVLLEVASQASIPELAQQLQAADAFIRDRQANATGAEAAVWGAAQLLIGHQVGLEDVLHVADEIPGLSSLINAILQPAFDFVAHNAALINAGLAKVATGLSQGGGSLGPGVTMVQLVPGAVHLLRYPPGSITAFDPAVGMFRIAVPAKNAGLSGVGPSELGASDFTEVAPSKTQPVGPLVVSLKELQSALSGSIFQSPIFWVGAGVLAIVIAGVIYVVATR